MNIPRIVILLVLATTSTMCLAQLDPPPGPITPTFKTLDQICPSTPRGPVTTPGNSQCIFEITQPGVYHLTGNIIGQAGKHGIRISASNVTLDLGGFTLMGVEGSLTGVEFNAYDADYNVTIRNGSVTGWDEIGVELGGCEGAVIEDIKSSYNGLQGVYVSKFAQLARITVIGNGDDGIYAYASCSIKDSVAARNADHGIFAGPGSTVRGCSAEDNGTYGFFLSSNATAQDCTARYNDVAGIYAHLGCTITNCTAGYNDTGFLLYGTSVLHDCNATHNDAVGILVKGVGNRVENNNVQYSPVCFDIDGRDNFVSGNTAGNSPLEYDITANNLVAPLTSAVTSSTPPFINFQR